MTSPSKPWKSEGVSLLVYPDQGYRQPLKASGRIAEVSVIVNDRLVHSGGIFLTIVAIEASG
jgi:hypothetical protein